MDLRLFARYLPHLKNKEKAKYFQQNKVGHTRLDHFHKLNEDNASQQQNRAFTLTNRFFSGTFINLLKAWSKKTDSTSNGSLLNICQLKQINCGVICMFLDKTKMLILIYS